MNKLSKMKTIALIAALVAGVSGAARADDNSMSIWNGDSYAAFNGGRNFPYGKPAVDTAPSAFRQTNPNGLSPREYQALSSDDPVWQIPNPDAARQLAATDEATSWRQSHLHGLTAREYEALSASSSGVAWRLTPEDNRAIAAENEAAVAKLAGKEPWDQRIARFLQGRGAASVN